MSGKDAPARTGHRLCRGLQPERQGCPCPQRHCVERAHDFNRVPSLSWRHSMHLPCRPPAAAGPERGTLRTPGCYRCATKPTGEALQWLMHDVGWHPGEDVGCAQLRKIQLFTKLRCSPVCTLVLQRSLPWWSCLDGLARLLPRRSRLCWMAAPSCLPPRAQHLPPRAQPLPDAGGGKKTA